MNPSEIAQVPHEPSFHASLRTYQENGYQWLHTMPRRGLVACLILPASMCKHVAAVLYGVGSRLDKNPMLFFELRDIDCQELIKKSMESKLENMLKNAGKKSKREIPETDIFDIFGV